MISNSRIVQAAAIAPSESKPSGDKLLVRYDLILSIASVIVGICIWHIVAAQYSAFILATPLQVATRLWELCADGQIPRAVGSALQHMILGFAIACLIAFPVGMLMGRSRVVFDLLDPLVNLIFAVPSVAWVPFIMIWCGLYFEARVALVVIMCMFDMLIVVSTGARNADTKILNVCRSFGASRWQVVRFGLLPESLPFIFTALRVGAVRSVNAMITAELFLATVNLGAIMKQGAVRFGSAAVLAVLVVLCLLGLSVQELILLVERRVCAWRSESR